MKLRISSCSALFLVALAGCGGDSFSSAERDDSVSEVPAAPDTSSEQANGDGEGQLDPADTESTPDEGVESPAPSVPNSAANPTAPSSSSDIGGSESGGSDPGSGEGGDSDTGTPEPGSQPSDGEPPNDLPAAEDTDPDPTPPTSEPCSGNDECPAGEYCLSASEACAEDQASVCSPMPAACDADYSPVCGCDGLTYGNACTAASAGMNQLHEGECEEDDPDDGAGGGSLDGGVAETGCQVGGVNYESGASGILAEDGCNTCACGNGTLACTRRACLPPAGGAACGARAGNTCSKDEYCAYVEGQHCGAADAEATCQPRPENCLNQFEPVCGCDNETYSNSCVANAAGMGVLSTGACEDDAEQ